jgi:hypothetical protein
MASTSRGEPIVPYLYCQSCRLTIYEGRMFAPFATTCPRCSGELDRKPASFFKSSRPNRGLGIAVPRGGRNRQPSAPLHGRPEPKPRREAHG